MGISKGLMEQILKVPPPHSRKKLVLCDMMKVVHARVAVILQYIGVSNQYTVHLKLFIVKCQIYVNKADGGARADHGFRRLTDSCLVPEYLVCC